MSAPPHDLEAEQSVLGAILLAPHLLDPIAETGLRPDEFYRTGHGMIFQAMLELHVKGDPIDVITLRHRLHEKGELAKAGGQATIDVLAGAVPMIGSWEQYAMIVRAKAKWRRRQMAAVAAHEASTYENEENWATAIAQADSAEPTVVDEVHPYTDFVEWYESDRSGWLTPFDRLTEAIGGVLVPGETSIMGGWPGHGKTVLAAQFLLHAIEKQQADARYYFNEMAASDLTARALAGMTGVPWELIHSKRLSASQLEKVKTAAEMLPVRYHRIEDWDLDQLDHHIRRNRPDIAVIDTATGINVRGATGVYDRMTAISNTLKRSARASGAHLILVVHLNLERCKQGRRPAPTGRDLLGGGSWYQDARQVFFVHRDQDQDDNMPDTFTPTLNGVVYADKATHGVPGESWTPVTFSPRMMRFLPSARIIDDHDHHVNGNTPAKVSSPYEFEAGF